MRYNFYVFNVVETNMVLGFQWLYSIGKQSMNYKIPQIIFKDVEGKLVVLKGMNTYPNQVIYTNSMRSILKHGDIEWDVECHITNEGTTPKVSYHPKDIKNLLHKHKGVFENLPH